MIACCSRRAPTRRHDSGTLQRLGIGVPRRPCRLGLVTGLSPRMAAPRHGRRRRRIKLWDLPPRRAETRCEQPRLSLPRADLPPERQVRPDGRRAEGRQPLGVSVGPGIDDVLRSRPSTPRSIDAAFAPGAELVAIADAMDALRRFALKRKSPTSRCRGRRGRGPA